jgi:hypothetical protein
MRHRTHLRFAAAAAALAAFALAPPARASDHDDTAELKAIPRHDARITDLFAFTRAGNLVLIVCANPAIPVGESNYHFADNLSFKVHLDGHSAVRFDDAEDVRRYGGTVVEPEKIAADYSFEITFKKGEPQLRAAGLGGREEREVRFFAGLRDDPFIRGPRIGRNVTAFVVELPAGLVTGRSSTLLVWATSNIPEVRGPIADHAGLPIRSQMPEMLDLNGMPPRDHRSVMGVAPDVLIFDTMRLAGFPNGRELTDDVVDLVGDARVLANDSPYPSLNDVPFLFDFPYLAPPHF